MCFRLIFIGKSESTESNVILIQIFSTKLLGISTVSKIDMSNNRDTKSKQTIGLIHA